VQQPYSICFQELREFSTWKAETLHAIKNRLLLSQGISLYFGSRSRVYLLFALAKFHDVVFNFGHYGALFDQAVRGSLLQELQFHLYYQRD